jgi:hypothetical protein
MSLGFGPKIYLRGAIPLYSNMVASATDLLCGGVSHLDSYCIFLVSMGMYSCLVLLDLFEFFTNMST